MLLDEDGLETQVSLIEPMGSETQVLCSSAIGNLTVLLRNRQQVTKGTPLKLNMQPGRHHLFDKATGQRLQD
ncbi:MAG: hypothetical protein DI635_16065 [Pseudoxanthomonas suwonensis]|nr:MAG: hypothetical protein DI635_16065 [Pseudoxanthomonas suwonensis]